MMVLLQSEWFLKKEVPLTRFSSCFQRIGSGAFSVRASTPRAGAGVQGGRKKFYLEKFL
jgi:hypothetical protein